MYIEKAHVKLTRQINLTPQPGGTLTFVNIAQHFKSSLVGYTLYVAFLEHLQWGSFLDFPCVFQFTSHELEETLTGGSSTPISP